MYMYMYLYRYTYMYFVYMCICWYFRCLCLHCVMCRYMYLYLFFVVVLYINAYYIHRNTVYTCTCMFNLCWIFINSWYSLQSYCLNGKCKTHTGQCRLLWGGTGRVSDPICFQHLNVNGSSTGNCGYNLYTQRYNRCDKE